MSLFSNAFGEAFTKYSMNPIHRCRELKAEGLTEFELLGVLIAEAILEAAGSVPVTAQSYGAPSREGTFPPEYLPIEVKEVVQEGDTIKTGFAINLPLTLKIARN